MSAFSFANVIIERNISCTMRDGIKLYADIYRPNNERTIYPVLLMRQPYGKSIASTITYAHPTWYANHGYIVVIQDVRGRGESEGSFNPFFNEAEDGFDTVEWAAFLPSSNGKVGMYGFSYQGVTQWAAASEQPPHLLAIAPGMCSADLYHGMFYPHGRFALKEHLPWAFQLARDTARRVKDADAEEIGGRVRRGIPDDLLYHLPLNAKHPLITEYFPAYYDWIEHSEYDDYWEKLNWLPKLLEKPIPALHIGGWYDVFMMGTLQTYEAMSQINSEANKPQHLIVGPWEHIPWGRKAGGVDHGPQADGDIHHKQLLWFDTWLKTDTDSDLQTQPAVTYFEMGSNLWRESEKAISFFQNNNQTKNWYLSGSVKPANGSLGGGKLLETNELISDAPPDVFVYDSRMPMPIESYVPIDRSHVEERYEILVYSSEPSAAPLRLLGSPQLTVYYQTLEGPTDLVAILTILQPDGTSRFLTVGRTEICSEAGENNDWIKLTFSLRPIAIELAAGTAIRLELTGSAFPLFMRHPNGIKSALIHQVNSSELQIASVAISSSQQLNSFLVLPVI
ncbi:CocE/NonD family hydrolase [Paenibacillus psychroresistens]|uniref:CocE/NonD family hydrolase n=1 Tax=Paenibacillus psychroresistens TaxID=1778678 RepID=A0A6B8RRK1_9BACL|nr:CocE/NonD family hydrolase [Paenibacillus psychroresistens]QGQ98342.1 CocE/NonD family hydrolase [Paenibacillus psychroresistens]